MTRSAQPAARGVTRRRQTRPTRDLGPDAAGTELELEVGPVAHGGHCVARHEGRVVFVRHALPGERVVVEPVPVEAGGREDGLRWRTRTQFAIDAEGRPGLRGHRSHDVVPLADCPISAEGVVASGVLAEHWGNVEALEVASGSDDGPPLVVVLPSAGRHPRMPKLPDASIAVRRADGTLERRSGRTWVGERVAVGGEELTFRVGGAGFWQVHRGAASTLSEAVLAALQPQAGERALDLYAGAGLFTAVLARAVGPDGAVLAVESEERAVRDARRSLHGLDHVGLRAERVEDVLATAPEDLGSADLVVLDPPRSGAGRAVVDGIAALAPRVVAYVACDPAALARDVAFFAERGYVLDGLRAFDLFPQTHHVECVARLVPREAAPAASA